MSQKLYKVEDIQLLFKELKVEIKKLKCFIEDCCAKIPINVGSGATLFKRLYRNNWEFKSILPGSNITITEQDDTITINSTGGGGGGLTCEELAECPIIEEIQEDVSNKWDLDGNTISNTDFIGSINNQDFTLKVGNEPVYHFSQYGVNIGYNITPEIGVSIGNNVISADGYSVTIGESASTTGAGGVAIGYNSVAAQGALALGVGATALANQFALPDTMLYAKWRGIPYEFPSLQGAASTVLTNNGAGVLSWQPTSLSPITTVSDTNTVDLTITATDLTADVNYQNTSTINLSEDINGLKADLATGASIANLGFTPEDVANKQTDLTTSATKYPTVDAVNTGLDLKQENLLIASATASNSAVIDFTLPTGYSYFELFIEHLIPQTNATSMFLRVSIDGGATFLAGATDYEVHRNTLSGSGGIIYVPSYGLAAQIAPIGSLIGNTSGKFFRASFRIFHPSDATQNKNITGEFAMLRSDGQPALSNLSARVFNTSPVNAIRILMSSGNIASGTFELWGYK